MPAKTLLAIATGLGAIGAAVLGVPALAAPPKVGERLNIVTCPMVRDTFVPAWLAQHEGDLYYLGPQGDLGAPFHPPQLSHKALIEGVVASDERISGGRVLSPLKVSVLPDIDLTCNTILPAAGFPDPPHHRTPGPTNTEEDEPRPAPVVLPKDRPATFDIPFAFDVGDHLFSRDSGGVSRAANFVRDSGAKKVVVTGYRGATVLTNGERMVEREGVAERRAAMVAKMLAHAGVPEDRIETATRRAVSEADGADDYLLRKVSIVVTP